MRVLVCGSRSITDRERVRTAIDELVEGWLTRRNPFANGIELIHGDMYVRDWLGVDREAAAYWLERAWGEVTPLPADWATHGRAAVPLRNQAMIDAKPDVVLAIWDGKSRGTLDAITRAAQAGIPVWIR